MTLLIPPRSQDIGFQVKRLLPSRLKQRVGPFIFVDHMGPAHFEAGTTKGDVRQHPHIGLATVTYLFSGAMMHRDSLGIVQRVEPGAINLMTAGNGIVHSERLPEDIRENNVAVEGIQTWLALPTDAEECMPTFAHYASERIPSFTFPGIRGRLLIGEAFGISSPVKTASKTTYIDMELKAHTEYQPYFPQQELAIYVIKGELQINDEIVPEFHVAVLTETSTIKSTTDSRILIFGGEPLAGDRYILWNFVSSSKEKLREASERWNNGEFEMVPDETDWIPFPSATPVF